MNKGNISSASKTPAKVSLEEAAQRLLDGGLVAFPTETVWGLGADAENPEAIAKIYRAKGRPSDHPVIVHLPPEADLSYWAQSIPEDARLLAAAFWPGPLTLILPRADRVPAQVSGGQASVGLRCPSHPVAQALLRTFAALKPSGQGGVAAPSANRFGRISPTRAQHVQAEFADSPEAILVLDGGDAMVGIESTIVDLSRYAEGVGPVLLRPGDISPAQLEAVLGKPVALPDQTAPRVSGSLKAHYAPRTPLFLLPTSQLGQLVKGGEQEGDDQAYVIASQLEQLIKGGEPEGDNQAYATTSQLERFIKGGGQEGDDQADATVSQSGQLIKDGEQDGLVLAVSTCKRLGPLIEGAEQEGVTDVAAGGQELAGVKAGIKSDRKIAVMALCSPPASLSPQFTWVTMPDDARAYAVRLYATLRELDEGGFDAILLEQPPQTAQWRAVNDRVQRAAAAFL